MDRDGWRSVVYEATLTPGGSGLTITGQIGDVMRESARAARSTFGRTRLNLDQD
jgi:ATP-dependent Lon protease